MREIVCWLISTLAGMRNQEYILGSAWLQSSPRYILPLPLQWIAFSRLGFLFTLFNFKQRGSTLVQKY